MPGRDAGPGRESLLMRAGPMTTASGRRTRATDIARTLVTRPRSGDGAHAQQPDDDPGMAAEMPVAGIRTHLVIVVVGDLHGHRVDRPSRERIDLSRAGLR